MLTLPADPKRGGDRGLRDCNRVASRWSSGNARLASSASPDCSFAGKEIKEYREMNHEGWLAKRSSGKISGRLSPSMHTPGARLAA